MTELIPAFVKVAVFGLPLVAFRDSDGSAHVLADTCVHRGGSRGYQSEISSTERGQYADRRQYGRRGRSRHTVPPF